MLNKYNPSAETRKAKSRLATNTRLGTPEQVAAARKEYHALLACDIIRELKATFELSTQDREHLAALLTGGGE